jgi:hypothetical protein
MDGALQNDTEMYLPRSHSLTCEWEDGSHADTKGGHRRFQTKAMGIWNEEKAWLRWQKCIL